jgi:outer membrane protein OmpA-like peptidoglycan-associated protein
MVSRRSIARRTAIIAFGVTPLLPLPHRNALADAVSLPSGTIVMPAEPLRFPAVPIDFPSFPDRIETTVSIEVVLPADVLFDFDKADIRPAAESTLQELAQIIRDKARGKVMIQGFTDAQGGDSYNQSLSERRAAAVSTWLVRHEAIPRARLATVGFGARNPVAANRHPDGSDDPEARQRNRRVTVIIRK